MLLPQGRTVHTVLTPGSHRYCVNANQPSPPTSCLRSLGEGPETCDHLVLQKDPAISPEDYSDILFAF